MAMMRKRILPSGTVRWLIEYRDALNRRRFKQFSDLAKAKRVFLRLSGCKSVLDHVQVVGDVSADATSISIDEAVLDNQREATFVYVIGPDDPDKKLSTPPIKIGKTHDPNNRLRSIQTGSARKIVHYALWEFPNAKAAMAAEKACHRKFRTARAHGEWFNVRCSDVLQFINAHFIEWGARLALYEPHH